MVLAVVGTVAVRSFASAVLICVWLDAVKVPGGQGKFSDGRGVSLMNCSGGRVVSLSRDMYGSTLYLTGSSWKNSVFDIANYNTHTV
jgi:hypothetical protein